MGRARRPDELHGGVERQPEPGKAGARAQAGTDLIELEVRQLQIAQEMMMDAFGLARRGPASG
jgi:hypothetical protein